MGQMLGVVSWLPSWQPRLASPVWGWGSAGQTAASCRYPPTHPAPSENHISPLVSGKNRSSLNKLPRDCFVYIMGSRKISEAAAATFDTSVWVGQTFTAPRNLLLIRTIKSYHTQLTLRVIFYEPLSRSGRSSLRMRRTGCLGRDL